MPELPEVETLRRSLQVHLPGCYFGRVNVFDVRLRRRVDPQQLADGVRGRRVLKVERRAKYLLIRLDDFSAILIHLGMSGRLRLQDSNEPREPHTHVVFQVDGNRELRFRDPRRFGVVEHLAPGTEERHPALSGLGIEPLEPGFNAEWLHAQTRASRKPIKNFLMDGTVIVGVGNIYASEALFEASLSPGRAAGRINRDACGRLVSAVKSVLSRAVEQGGTTLNDFQNANGQSGYFQVSLNVYDRAGAKCVRCDGLVRRRIMAGRSTYYCPRCQK